MFQLTTIIFLNDADEVIAARALPRDTRVQVGHVAAQLGATSYRALADIEISAEGASVKEHDYRDGERVHVGSWLVRDEALIYAETANA